jgi:hypothetical protein
MENNDRHVEDKLLVLGKDCDQIDHIVLDGNFVDVENVEMKVFMVGQRVL